MSLEIKEQKVKPSNNNEKVLIVLLIVLFLVMFSSGFWYKLVLAKSFDTENTMTKVEFTIYETEEFVVIFRFSKALS